jgi:hypothetical protein
MARNWLVLGPAVLLAPASLTAYAVSYLSIEQAQRQMFPGQSLAPAFVNLSDDQARQIEARSGVDVRRREVRVWRASGGGWFVADDVVGKHEFISFALALTADGRVMQVDVLDYRESYGGQVRESGWRAQFTGKTVNDPVRLGADIRNISGATLSSKNLTNGVRRLLAFYEVVLRRGTR